MYLLNQKSPTEMSEVVAKNLKIKRKKMKFSQLQLAEKSGVSLASIKRFENKFEIAFTSLIKLAIVLDCESDLENLFKQKTYSSINEVINEQL
jgi:transcriptional regulator with XRE-family HTH domain